MLEHEYLAFKTHQAREIEHRRKDSVRRSLAEYITQYRMDRRRKKTRQ